jgi:hypothetical protein
MKKKLKTFYGFGSGWGDGSGSGWGDGSGDGSGSGSGYGSGNHSGSGSGNSYVFDSSYKEDLDFWKKPQSYPHGPNK